MFNTTPTPIPAPLWDTIRAELQRILIEEPPITSPREGVMLLAEQLFSLHETVRNSSEPNNPRRVRYEATQLAALTLRFLVEMPNWTKQRLE